MPPPAPGPDLPVADRHDVVLPGTPSEVASRLDAAGDDREAVAAVVAEHPALPAVWAALAPLGRDPVERSAAARVGYHRGLDQMRANGWGGRGFVRWSAPTNRGVLTCLARLRDAAREIGEEAEVARLDAFLRDLDPDWDDANTA